MTHNTIETEATRIIQEIIALSAPNSPAQTHFMTRISPDFLSQASSRDLDRLFDYVVSIFPHASFTTSKKLQGLYVMVPQSPQASPTDSDGEDSTPDLEYKYKLQIYDAANDFVKEEFYMNLYKFASRYLELASIGEALRPELVCWEWSRIGAELLRGKGNRLAKGCWCPVKVYINQLEDGVQLIVSPQLPFEL